MRIGIVSDTHLPSVVRELDELGPQIGDLFRTVDLILHAGDVTAPSVVEWCEQFAPTLVARGNNDLFEHPQMRDSHVLEAEGWRIGMVHALRPAGRPLSALLDEHLGGAVVDVLVSGDTHLEGLDRHDGLLLLNPGSPTLPHHKEYRLGTAALLEVTPQSLRAEILVLGQTEGAPNPGIPQTLEVNRR